MNSEALSADASFGLIFLRGTVERSRPFPNANILSESGTVSGFLWIVVIGLIAGVVARFLLPGPNNPNGFVFTAVLGIAGAFVATWIGQSIGWYSLNQGAGLIGATFIVFILSR